MKVPSIPEMRACLMEEEAHWKARAESMGLLHESDHCLLQNGEVEPESYLGFETLNMGGSDAGYVEKMESRQHRLRSSAAREIIVPHHHMVKIKRGRVTKSESIGCSNF